MKRAVLTLALAAGLSAPVVADAPQIGGVIKRAQQLTDLQVTDAEEQQLGTITGTDADPDRDGLSNLQEYQSGTLPKNPESVLRLHGVHGDDGHVRVILSGVRGRAYIVEWRERIETGAWQTLQSIPALTEDTMLEILDPDAPSANRPRFYRVHIPASSP